MVRISHLGLARAILSRVTSAILDTHPLGSPPWATIDPFLFCVYHLDHYPQGNAGLGPAESLAGRQLGMDFSGQSGWSMYHGREIPGFPQHPHRGFETITIARRGTIDHSDSLGAAARLGSGDVQWMTAGQGIVHSEMFPLLRSDQSNPLELFQIWLNLPSDGKLVAPHFSMTWSETMPRVRLGGEGPRTEVSIIAGAFAGATPPPPPPNSWAARAEADVALWTIEMESEAELEIPAARGADTRRTLYFFEGSQLRVAGTSVPKATALVVAGDRALRLENLGERAECLLLQGRPIGEPVAQQGPFVMNTQAELREAFADYQRTQFGGWPWPSDAPVHDRHQGRFARHADGRMEHPPTPDVPV